MANKRWEKAIFGSLEGAFAHLSPAALLNLLFLTRGEWGSIEDYVMTQRTLRATVDDDLLLWADRTGPSPAPSELVNRSSTWRSDGLPGDLDMKYQRVHYPRNLNSTHYS